MNMGPSRKALAWALALMSITSTLPFTGVFAGAAPTPTVVTAADQVFPQFGATPGHSFAPDVSGRGFNQSLIKWKRAFSLTEASSVVANFASDVHLNNTTSSPDVLGVVWAYPTPPPIAGATFVSIGAGNNGTLMWNYLIPGTAFGTPVASDLNGDGKMDLVLRSDTGFYQAVTPNITWDGSNWLYPFTNLTEVQDQQMWNASLSGESSLDNNASTMIAADIVGNGLPEVLAPAGDRLFLLAGDTGSEIRNVTVDGTIVSAPTVGRVGGSSRVYVVSTNRTAANASAVRSEYILSAFDSSLNFLWNATFYESYDTSLAYKSLDLQLPSPAAGDLDGGGSANDLALVTPYENSVGRLRIFYNGSNSASVNVSLRGLTGSSPAVADLDGDGRAEIVALSYLPGTPVVAPNSQAYVEVFAGNGTLQWNATIDEVPGPGRENTLAPPAIADLSNDGIKDVVVFLTDGASEVRSGTNGSRILRHQIFDQATPTEFSGPCVADLDNDGFLDITANAAAVSFALADLHLNASDIGLNNTGPEQFEDVQVTATVHNGGNTLASNITVAFFDGATKLNETSLAVILAGGSAQALVNVNFSGGGHRQLTVVADANHTVEEINEGNNTAVLTVNVTSLYGFHFESPVNRSSVQPGFSYAFILNAVSEGTGSNRVDLTAATLPVNWTAGLAPSNLTLEPAGSLGDTNTSFFTITTDVSSPVGIYDIEVSGVSANNPRNTARIIFTVIIGGQFGASLYPRSGAQNVTAGDTAIYTLEVLNAGNSPDTFDLTNSSPPAGWTVTLTRSSSPPLPSGGRTTFAVTVRSPSAATQGENASVTITARSQNDTLKNDTAVFVTTVVVPDLVVDSVRFFRGCGGEAFYGSPSLIAGEVSRIQATVRNAALNAPVNSLRVRFLVEGVFTDVPTTIGPDGLGTANLSVTYTAGAAKQVLATVDPGNLISELDEGNNDLQGTVTVKDPSPVGSFTVVGTVYKGGSGVAGASVTLTNAARSVQVEVTAAPDGTYSATLTAAQFLDGDSLRIDATDGLDVGNATACAYSEDVQVARDITLTLPSPYDFLMTAVGATTFEGAPGSNVTYDVTVTNRGPFNNTILLTVSSIWQARVLDANGSAVTAVLLAPNGSASLRVEVVVPPGASPGDASLTALNGSAAADASRVRGVGFRTTAGVLRSLTASLDVSSGSALAGTEISVSLTVVNAGNGEENISLTPDCTGPSGCNSWVTMDPYSLTLSRGASASATITVRVAPAAVGGVYTLNFTAKAANDSTVRAMATFTLTAIEVRYQFSVTGPSSLRLIPGETRSTSITVTNRGTVPDNYTATTASGSGGFTVTLAPGAGTTAAVSLDPGASAVVTLTIETPLEVEVESYPVDILFESVARGTQSIITVNGTIGPVYDFRVSSVRVSSTPEVGVEIQIFATVSNIGFRAFNGVLEVRLWVAGQVFMTQEIRSLGVAAEETVVFRWTPRTPGSVNLTVDVNKVDGSPYFESSFANNLESVTAVVAPTQAGGFLTERGFQLFLLALLGVFVALVAISRKKGPEEEAPHDEEKAQEETEERRKGKESGGIGRI